MRNGLIAVLMLLAVFQIGALATARGDANGRWLAAGDGIESIEIADAAGERSSLVLGEPTLVLVFHSECGHCRRVAPTWRTWLEQHGGEARVVAVSTESHDIGAAYAEEHGWEVEVRTVVDADLGSPAHALTSRTPWVFAVDARGRVVDEGQGMRIAEIGALATAGADR